MKKIILTALTLILINLPIVSPLALAANNLSNSSGITDKVANKAGYNTGQNDILKIISLVILTVLSLLGVIFLIIIIYGGYRWMTGRDNSGEVDKAISTIKNGVIGLIIVVGAYAIAYFVMKSLMDAGTLS